ncbi:hypothetical protein GQ600_17512 [Phytophthora cactorum]|nr:hypothetical protein GQ600_17512 [Phytophthora cactorum]
MVRMREPQRFPLGTRVANPVEGRTGEIKAFDLDTGLYTLVYNDDHRDVLNASQTEQFVIRKSPEEEAKEAEQRQKEKEADPNQYLGATLEEVKQNLKQNDKESDSEGKRSGGPDGAQSPSSKKKKHHHHHEEEKERPLNTQKFDSRRTAYTHEKQKVVLNNKDLQPKKALEAFVEADGLQTLEKMLAHWFRMDSTRSASLLVMKVLAMIPGVKEEHLRKTNIARTLRDLAQWIIKKWARTAMNRSFNRSARDLLLEQQAQISRAATDGQVHVAPRSTAKLTPQQKETARLEALRAGTDAAAEAEQDPGEEVVVYLPQFNSLGSEDMRRPVRQTQVIESLAAKINRDYEDSLKRHEDGEDDEKEDGVAQGRMVFGKPQLMKFSQHIPVMDLFATARSKIVVNNAAAGGSTDVLRLRLGSTIILHPSLCQGLTRRRSRRNPF